MQYSSLLLGCQFLIQHYLPIKFKYWQKKVNEEQRENKLKKQTQTQTEMETKIGNGITLHGPWAR